MAETSEPITVLNSVKKGDFNPKDPQHMHLESLSLLLTTERLHKLEKDCLNEITELKARQKKVAFLHKLMRTINSKTDPKGEFDATSHADFKEMLKKANELGVELDEAKEKYTTEERDRLLENIRMTVEDHNMLNELQLQTLSRMTTERYESYQMARSISKPIHEAKSSHLRAIGGSSR
jgi:hypothetical protein